MKILFICSGNNYYGISPFIKSQGDSLIKVGVELDYFLIQGKGFTGYTRVVLKLRRWLKKNPVDLLHAHFGLCGWVTYLAKPKRIPMVLSYMGSDILPVKKGRVAPNSLIARFCRALQNRVDHVIVKSKNLEDLLTRKSSITIIPNGVDLDRFKLLSREECLHSLGLSKNWKIVLFLGDPNDERKNFLLLKEAIEIISSLDFHLILPFPIQPEQIQLYLNAADVLVLSSISEGSPNVIKEAMACNCPIVSTDVGDVRWILGDTPGCFISSFSPDDMALKIKMALNFNKKTTGRERIIKLGLDCDSIAKRIIEIYKSINKN